MGASFACAPGLLTSKKANIGIVMYVCPCAFFEQAPIVLRMVARAQRAGPSFHYFVLPLMHKTGDQQPEHCKLPGEVQ